MTDLMKQIDQLVEQRTFSLEAAPAISALKETAKKQADRIVDLEMTIQNQAKEARLLKDDLLKAKASNEAWSKREKELVERESKIGELEKSTAIAQAGLSAFRECAGMFLKNTITREAIQSSQPVSVPVSPTGGGGGYVTAYETRQNISRETE